MDHLSKVQGLIGCADQEYVIFDLIQIQSSIQDGETMTTGIQVIVISVMQAILIGLYTQFYKFLVEEQQRYNAELFNPVHG